MDRSILVLMRMVCMNMRTEELLSGYVELGAAGDLGTYHEEPGDLQGRSGLGHYPEHP